ncbi:TetR family transcriptional regulator [Amycolatopsis sp. NPDC004079]|uniref:TetR/AcrR family transcriptional regulator n=1 Tax=Amycolatopsis sp. NPDC004079 TaxID=3154549 RepID=UPI0033A8FB34
MVEDFDARGRSGKRQLSEARILAAARRQFARQGYNQTTIRGIAAAAGVDPTLVMRYFGSKDELFSQVTEDVTPDEPTGSTPGELAESLLTQLTAKLDEEPVAALALLRSMLSQRGAAVSVRKDLSSTARDVSRQITANDPELRTSLVGAISIGVIVARYILRLDGLKEASTERVEELLRPCIHSLVVGTEES